VLLGGLEHGIYVDNEDGDECLGMSTTQICQYFGIEQDSDEDGDEMSTQEEGIHISGDIGDEDSIIETDVDDQDSIIETD